MNSILLLILLLIVYFLLKKRNRERFENDCNKLSEITEYKVENEKCVAVKCKIENDEYELKNNKCKYIFSGEECFPEDEGIEDYDENGMYKYNDSGKCILDKCLDGFTKNNNKCVSVNYNKDCEGDDIYANYKINENNECKKVSCKDSNKKLQNDECINKNFGVACNTENTEIKGDFFYDKNGECKLNTCPENYNIINNECIFKDLNKKCDGPLSNTGLTYKFNNDGYCQAITFNQNCQLENIKDMDEKTQFKINKDGKCEGMKCIKEYEKNDDYIFNKDSKKCEHKLFNQECENDEEDNFIYKFNDKGECVKTDNCKLDFALNKTKGLCEFTKINEGCLGENNKMIYKYSLTGKCNPSECVDKNYNLVFDDENEIHECIHKDVGMPCSATNDDINGSYAYDKEGKCSLISCKKTFKLESGKCVSENKDKECEGEFKHTKYTFNENGECVISACKDSNYSLRNGECVFSNIGGVCELKEGEGDKLSNTIYKFTSSGNCVASSCSSGYQFNNESKACDKIPELCTVSNGDPKRLYYKENGQCVKSMNCVDGYKNMNGNCVHENYGNICTTSNQTAGTVYKYNENGVCNPVKECLEGYYYDDDEENCLSANI